MATGQLSEVIQHVRRAVLLRDGAGLTDRQLLEAYISRRDQAALAALVQRHGPMVWGVCRRALSNYHDAEDAFQATFLVLVRKAAAIASPELLANWLYGVAHQTALKARGTVARRKARERQVTQMPEPAVVERDLWNDLRPLLDQELSRLPDVYRVVIVLCDLEGKTRKEAARHLGLPEGTIASRLARARVFLAKRLTARGVTLSGGALAVLLAQNVASAGVPSSVVDSTIQVASLLAAGQAATGAISFKVAALTEGVMKAMWLTKLRAVFAVVLLVGFVATGVTIFTCRPAAGQDDKPSTAIGLGNSKEPADQPAKGAEARLWTEFGVKVETVSASAVRRAKKDLGGGLKILAVRPDSPAAKAKLQEGDILVGLHTWETLSIDACLFILDQCREDQVASLKCSLVRNGRFQSVFAPLPPKVAPPREGEEEVVTAWGKEVGGVQAGLGYLPGQNRAYHPGETVKLVVRVRNVGKKEVKFAYFNEFFGENPPAVTDGAVKPVDLEGVGLGGLARLMERKLAPGKEVELCELSLRLQPESERGKERPVWALYGTGKFQLQYANVGGSNIGTGAIKFDPVLSNLATGNLELEIVLPTKRKAGAAGHPLDLDRDTDVDPDMPSKDAKADSPTESRATTIKIKDVSYTLPFTFPSSEEILRALPNGKARPKDARIQCDLVACQLDEPRLFPLVGRAQLLHAHFRCTVVSDQGKEVVSIHRDQLIPLK